MSQFFVAVLGLCAIALIAFSALTGIALNGFWPEIFSNDFWATVSSLATAGGAIATAFAASVAVVVFKHQKTKEADQEVESNSKYYMDQCHDAVERAVDHLIEKKGNSESIISAGLILGEVTQLEQLITVPKHQRLYTIHRQNLISRCEDTLTSLTDYELSCVNVKQNTGYVTPLSLGEKAIGVEVDIRHVFEEMLLDGKPFITHFQGIPLGRLLCLLRFFVNDPHFTPPEDRLTKRELNELDNLRPISHFKRYVESCLTLEYRDGCMHQRETPICVHSINMNYDLNIHRIYFD